MQINSRILEYESNTLNAGEKLSGRMTLANINATSVSSEKKV